MVSLYGLEGLGFRVEPALGFSFFMLTPLLHLPTLKKGPTVQAMFAPLSLLWNTHASLGFRV